MPIKMELFNDNFQNFKQYNIPRAQLVIADIPYNVGNNFYGSNPEWYIDGDNKNGESDKAGKAAFNTDYKFNIVEYFHFCNKLLKPEPNEKSERGRSSEAPCMIIFCSFEQLNFVIETLVFVKQTSPQVLKANMRIVGATEYALVLYRGKLPKFRNNGCMIKNWFLWQPDDRSRLPKVHPTQKPIKVLENLIEIFTDPGDVVIDPCAGSGSTLMAARNLGRNSYGFEVSKPQYLKTCKEFLHLKPDTIGGDNFQEYNKDTQITFFDILENT